MVLVEGNNWDFILRKEGTMWVPLYMRCRNDYRHINNGWGLSDNNHPFESIKSFCDVLGVSEETNTKTVTREELFVEFL